MKIYCIVDKEAKVPSSVFVAPNDEYAIRAFLSLLTGPRNVFTDFPEQFDLYPVGELSYTPGTLKVCEMNSTHLESNGFTYNSFRVCEPIKCGSEYDRRYLKMVHDDIFTVVEPPAGASGEYKNLTADLTNFKKNSEVSKDE